MEKLRSLESDHWIQSRLRAPDRNIDHIDQEHLIISIISDMDQRNLNFNKSKLMELIRLSCRETQKHQLLQYLLFKCRPCLRYWGVWEQIFCRIKASQARPRLPGCHSDQERSWLYSHRTQPTWWAFLSFFPPHDCMSCHLGVCRVIIDGLPRWCVDRTQQRRSLRLSVWLSAPFWWSAAAWCLFKEVNHLNICCSALLLSGYTPDEGSFLAEKSNHLFDILLLSHCSSLKLWLCGHR